MFQFTDKIIYFIVHTASFITNKIRKNDKKIKIIWKRQLKNK